MTGSSPEGVEGRSEADSTALSYSHMLMGTSLPSPGEVPLERGIVHEANEHLLQAGQDGAVQGWRTQPQRRLREGLRTARKAIRGSNRPEG